MLEYLAEVPLPQEVQDNGYYYIDIAGYYVTTCKSRISCYPMMFHHRLPTRVIGLVPCITDTPAVYAVLINGEAYKLSKEQVVRVSTSELLTSYYSTSKNVRISPNLSSLYETNYRYRRS